MARTSKSITEKKTSAPETVTVTETKKETVSGKIKIQMRCVYIGTYGNFYAGQEYELDANIANQFIKNGDAIKC